MTPDLGSTLDTALGGLGRHVETWRPEAVTHSDGMPVHPAAAMAGLLDKPTSAVAAGDALHPLWHWLYFLEWPAQTELGTDGHPREGHFLPPMPDRQRMFAGGRCRLVQPLRLEQPAERVSSLQAVTAKQGSTGALLFVTVRYEYRQCGAICLVEEQDIVYRSGRSQGQPAAVVDTSGSLHSQAPWQFRLVPETTLLFRFSALTANAHRIHYDEPYARGEENYPGLVVHGPLLVLTMLELVRRNAPRRRVSTVSYRLRRPAYGGQELLAAGTPTANGATLHVDTACEPRHATAQVTFE
ncbi:hypothetical protein ACQPXT_34235 [Streptomyces sp. CA-100214]